MLAIMKMIAVTTGSADFLKLGLVHDLVTIGMMIKGWIPEFKPFAVLFVLEALAHRPVGPRQEAGAQPVGLAGEPQIDARRLDLAFGRRCVGLDHARVEQGAETVVGKDAGCGHGSGTGS